MSKTKIVVMRYNSDAESTQGLVVVNGKFFCYSLEDQRQEGAKVKGETRIPEGSYKLGIKAEYTPLTDSYAKRYPKFFKRHIQILDVPGFENVYIHVGNDETHTDGCLLLGDTAVNDPKDYNGFQGSSRQAYERFYRQFYDRVKDGSVELEIKNIAF